MMLQLWQHPWDINHTGTCSSVMFPRCGNTSCIEEQPPEQRPLYAHTLFFASQCLQTPSFHDGNRQAIIPRDHKVFLPSKNKKKRAFGGGTPDALSVLAIRHTGFTGLPGRRAKLSLQAGAINPWYKYLRLNTFVPASAKSFFVTHSANGDLQALPVHTKHIL